MSLIDRCMTTPPRRFMERICTAAALQDRRPLAQRLPEFLDGLIAVAKEKAQVRTAKTAPPGIPCGQPTLEWALARPPREILRPER